MKKLTDFLEKYVQWVALGVGVLWIGFMAYLYWAGPNAQVTVAGPGGSEKPYGPGELDNEMANGTSGPGKDLRDATDPKAPSVVPKKPKGADSSTKPSFVTAYQLALAGNATDASDFIDAIIPGNKGGATMALNSTAQTTAVVKAHIPELKGDELLAPLTGKDAAGLVINAVSDIAVVQIPDPSTLPKDPLKAEADAAAVAAGGGIAGVAAAPVNPVPVNVPPPSEVELSYVTGSYKFDMTLLRQAFNEAKIPVGATSSFLAVTVIRQTLSDSKWGDEVEVPPLANRVVPPLPAENDVQNSRLYLVWAQKNTADLVHPPFYVVSKGTPWRTVTMPPLAVDPNATPAVAADQAFDPANPPKDRPLTVEENGKVYLYQLQQKRELAKQKAEEYKAKQAEKKTSQPGGGAGGGTGTGAGGGAKPARGYSPIPVLDDQITPTRPANVISGREPILLADATPAATVGGERPVSERPIARRPASQTPIPATPTTPGAIGGRPLSPDGAGGQPGEALGASFDPATASDVEIFFHDDTVEPGKTYRYQIIVYIKNPLFDTRGLAENQKDADIFALKIQSPWSGPVVVQQKYFFFLAQAPNFIGARVNAKVDYFFWSDGIWQSKTLPVQPGDAIGDTDWTVTDLRKVPHDDRHSRVLFTNAQGTIISRSAEVDKADPEYKRMKDNAGKPGAGVVPVSVGDPPGGTPAATPGGASRERGPLR